MAASGEDEGKALSGSDAPYKLFGQPLSTPPDSKTDYKKELISHAKANEIPNFGVNWFWQCLDRFNPCSLSLASKSLSTAMLATFSEVALPAAFIGIAAHAIMTIRECEGKTFSDKLEAYKKSGKYAESLFFGVYTIASIMGWSYGYTAVQLGEFGFMSTVPLAGNALLERLARASASALGTVIATGSASTLWGSIRVLGEEAGYLSIDKEDEYKSICSRVFSRTKKYIMDCSGDMPGDFIWSCIDDSNLAKNAYMPCFSVCCGTGCAETFAICCDALTLSTSVSAANLCTRMGIYALDQHCKTKSGKEEVTMVSPQMTRSDDTATESAAAPAANTSAKSLSSSS